MKIRTRATDGYQRRRVRVRWWDQTAISYQQAALLDDAARQQLPDCPIPAHNHIGHDGGTPVFILFSSVSP